MRGRGIRKGRREWMKEGKGKKGKEMMGKKRKGNGSDVEKGKREK